MIPGAFPIITGGGFRARGVTFDGIDDYLSRSGALSGISNTETGTWSFWAKVNGGDDSDDVRGFFSFNTATDVPVCTCYLRDATSGESNQILCFGDRYQVHTGVEILAGPTWRHIACSFQFHNFLLYVDGSLAFSTTLVPTSGSYNYTGAVNLNIARRDGTRLVNADLAEFWWDTSFLDLSVSANLAKFRNPVTGKPMRLGSDGSAPTGSQPAVYLSGPASQFHINKGYGGNFTVNGSPTDASSSPSD